MTERVDQGKGTFSRSGVGRDPVSARYTTYGLSAWIEPFRIQHTALSLNQGFMPRSNKIGVFEQPERIAGMDDSMRRRLQACGAWCGIGAIVTLLIGFWVVAGFLPLHGPTMHSETIAKIYQEHPLRIRFGMVILMFGSMLFTPFGAALADQISEFEKKTGPLSILVMFGAYSFSIFGFYSGIWYIVTAFRPERSAELTLIFSDSAWLQFVGGASLGVPLFASVAVVAFADTRQRPLYPRWIAWVTTFVLLTAIPSSQLVFFFREGPFAWNGVIGFWLPAVDLGLWLALMVHVMLRAAKAEGLQRDPAVDAPIAS
jgi:hypothetical protein